MPLFRRSKEEPMPTIPPSPEVLAAEALQLDPTLRREATALREQLEPLAARIIPLIEQVTAFHDRAWATADAVSGDPLGDHSTDIWQYLYDACGIAELDSIRARIGAAFPPGSVEVEALTPCERG
jgi:hypothetical protein